jgi:hypothetical protein
MYEDNVNQCPVRHCNLLGCGNTIADSVHPNTKFCDGRKCRLFRSNGTVSTWRKKNKLAKESTTRKRKRKDEISDDDAVTAGDKEYEFPKETSDDDEEWFSLRDLDPELADVFEIRRLKATLLDRDARIRELEQTLKLFCGKHESHHGQSFLKMCDHCK